MKYRIIILIIIIISLDQILSSYIANTSHTRTHARTHTRTHVRTHARTRKHTYTHALTHTCTHSHTRPSPFRLSLFDGFLAPNRNTVNVPFRRMAINGRSLVHSNKHSPGRYGVRECFGVFAYKKIVRPNWDTNSWQDVLLVDTNSLRHLPRRSSKNFDI